MTQLPPYLTPKQAAQWLTAAGVPVTEDAVRRWARLGRVSRLKLPGGQYLISEESLREILSGEPATAVPVTR